MLVVFATPGFLVTGIEPPPISNMWENALVPLYAWPLEPSQKSGIIIDDEFEKLTHPQVTHIRENIKENSMKSVQKKYCSKLHFVECSSYMNGPSKLDAWISSKQFSGLKLCF